MVTLADMTEAEYQEYIGRTLVRYAREGGEATGMEPAEALKKARGQFASLLPDGRATEDQHFQNVVADTGESVGILWWALQKDGAQVFIYDIDIDADRRGHGYGSAALRGLEAEARRIDATEIALHVFTTNAGAIRLYERLGYHVTGSGPGGQGMAKALGGAR